MSSFFINLPSTGSGSGEDSILRGKYVRTTRFASIVSGTSGSVTLPSGSEVVLDDFGGTVDAVVSQISGGKPTLIPATNSQGERIAATFDSDGDWTLTGTPSSYPVALIYRVKQTFEDYDSDSADIFGVPEYEQTSINIQKFSSSGTWSKPAGAKLVRVYALGGGGGGGSARKGAAGTVRCGGGGGGPGVFASADFDASLLGSTETVTIGAGGQGGVGITANDTNGNAGSTGGTTSFGTHFQALGGGGGGGGTNSAGTAGAGTLTAVTPWNFAQASGAAASATGGSGANAGSVFTTAPSGGASGAGITSADAANFGGVGGVITNYLSPAGSVAGGLSGGSPPAAGGNGNSYVTPLGLSIGTGGGSARASITGDTGVGGNGGPGAGGAGGSAVLNSTGNGGAGGNGGNGWLVAITFF